MSVWGVIGAAMVWLAMVAAYGEARAATVTNGKPLPSLSPSPLPLPSLLPSKDISSSLGVGIGVTITFTITEETRRSDYENFLSQILAALGPPDQVHGVPRLRQPTLAVSDPNRYFLINVRSYNGNLVTFAVDVTNVYLVGFRVEGYSYFFQSDEPQPRPIPYPAAAIFPGTQATTLSYTASYTALDPERGSRLLLRQTLPLGINELSEAIDDLHEQGINGRVVYHQSLIPSILVAAQTISESVRFNGYAQLTLESIREDGEVPHERGRPATLNLISQMTEWRGLSDALQRNPMNPRTVLLQRDDYSQYPVSSVVDILAIGIRLLLFVNCNRNNNYYYNHNEAIIRIPGYDAVQKGSISSGVDDSDTCPDSVPMLIRGYNGMCLEVKDGKFEARNLVVMNACADKVSQNWTLNSNGSITSNGMCLTVLTGGPPEVGISTCNPQWENSWQLLDDGSIYSTNEKKVLTVYKSGSIYYLSLTPQTNYLIAQGWKTGLLSTPPYWNASIVGIDNLCLQTDGSVLWLAACTPTVTGQQWLIYPDGSVRPNINFPNNCLTSSLKKGQPISVTSCSETKQGQRWNFAIDGTIQDLAGCFVMDVYNNDITQHIITWTANGGANQQWVAKFVS